MPTILTTLMHLAAQLAQGKLADARSRLVRSLGVLCVIMVLIAVAVAMGTAALTVALADRIGLVPALLSIAAVATIIALILALTIRTRVDRPATNSPDLLSVAARELPRVDPLIIVVAALAVGLLLGRRKG
jgi:cytochrome bd-type quinol oxidase subunit 2